jgi:PGF-pre-PGF domain-containing protein
MINQLNWDAGFFSGCKHASVLNNRYVTPGLVYNDDVGTQEYTRMNYVRTTLGIIILACVLLSCSAAAAPFAYITNSGWNDVSVIDTATNTVTAWVDVGSGPIGVAVSPDGSKVYVTNSGDGTVSVINAATNTVIGTPVTVGNNPRGVAVSPDGSKVYVTNLNDNTVSVINAATNTIIGTPVTVGTGPFGVVVSPDGSKVYVANSFGASTTVSVIKTSDNSVTTVTVGSRPTGVAVSPDGSKVYVTNNNAATVSVIDTSSNTVTATVPVESNPKGDAVSPDGSKVYVANEGTGRVSVIKTSDNSVTTVTVGSVPYGVAVSPDGSKVYVANSGSNKVSVIKTSDNSVTTVDVGTSPCALGQFIIPPDAVIYNSNGATGGTVPVDGSSAYVSGATVAVLGNTGSLVRTGYTFSKWNTATDGSGTSYSPGATFTIAANTILYAQWTTTVTPTPTSSGGGGSGSVSGSSSGSATGAASVSNIDPGRATAFSFNQNIGANQPVALNSVQITFSQHVGTASVTGTTVNTGISAPVGKTVVGYLQITPLGINDNAITHGVITFTVDGQYLSSHNMNPAQVVMMRDHDGLWTALPTTLIGQNGNTYTYQVVTPGFSYYAIVVNTPNSSANVTVSQTSVPANVTVNHVVITEPVTTMTASQEVIPSVVATAIAVSIATTAVPAIPQPAPGLPLATIALIGAGCVVIIGCGFAVRRWWIHRQNPALFRKDD